MEESKPSIFKKKWVQTLTGIILITTIFVGVLIYKNISSRISTDEAVISAPLINIGPTSSGILDAVYVRLGDTVTSGENLASVSGEILSAKVSGKIIEVTNSPGQVFTPTQPVIKMIDPTELRVVATIKENEGLVSINPGDPVSFTVDAFPGKNYVGIVESISPTSVDSGVVFSISDKREVKQFEVKIKYDVSENVDFKNGMSAKVKIYKK
jgi:multidrug resistance efflux pump